MVGGLSYTNSVWSAYLIFPINFILAASFLDELFAVLQQVSLIIAHLSIPLCPRQADIAMLDVQHLLVQIVNVVLHKGFLYRIPRVADPAVVATDDPVGQRLQLLVRAVVGKVGQRSGVVPDSLAPASHEVRQGPVLHG